MENLSAYLLPRRRNSLLILGGATALCVLATWLCLQAYKQNVIAEATLQRADALRAALAIRPTPKLTQSDRDLLKKWASLKVERDFAWKPLFAALESAASPDIELLEFDPDKSNMQLMLSGEAKTQRALIDFLAALGQQPLFTNVHLTHQQKKARDRLETVTFELKATISD